MPDSSDPDDQIQPEDVQKQIHSAVEPIRAKLTETIDPGADQPEEKR
jgi:hypothetical protein